MLFLTQKSICPLIPTKNTFANSARRSAFNHPFVPLQDTEKERALWLNQFKCTGFNPNREEVISKLIAQLEKYAKEDAEFFKQLHTNIRNLELRNKS